ncbi:MAG: protein-L-isoaspartate O-methyltransferase [Rhodocyclaceae bacterium]|jgi:protein-L-isoaspartate(D-aspartate) O-methyltransferase|nr:protein-L-isoaspartate O-methyltransferase [Rhodocyclaceae bacterium]MCA3056949.1 protein-L-isoaspartate O-methyltransferase [Rhodocyclaceae bacterium]
MDIEQARFNMVEQQIRTWEVLDQSVLELLFNVKREDFVPAVYRSLAFVDMEIPLGEGQLMMPPKLEARILQEVAPKAHERVLEIGTGSGYLSALLASRAAKVASIEYFESLAVSAAAKLAAAGIGNVEITTGDAARSPAKFVDPQQQFDVVVFTGSLPVLPAAYLPRLAVGGRLFAIIGDAPAMKAMLYTKATEQSTNALELFETVVAPLLNAEQPSRFTF